MEPTRPKVLAVADYYLPGFKAGGPIRTISNIRRALHDDIDLDLFTRDRDLGDAEAYQNIHANSWTNDDYGRIYYADPRTFGLAGFHAAIKGTQYDILYLNSFFSPHGSIVINAALQWQGTPLRTIIAPRGEFSPEALLLKRKKKQAFLAMARTLNIYRRTYWHVSSSAERNDLLRIFPFAEPRTFIASDPIDAIPEAMSFSPKVKGRLKLAFISRISPMKNLHGLLQALRNVRRLVTLNIYGPIEDTTYWALCSQLIKALPSNISANWNGALHPADVAEIFSRHDVFAFPTKGENFGHVIYEALSVGTPVLLSDKTPWTEDGSPAIRILPLANSAAWSTEIEALADRSSEEQFQARHAALSYARTYAEKNAASANTLSMFCKISSQ